MTAPLEVCWGQQFIIKVEGERGQYERIYFVDDGRIAKVFDGVVPDCGADKNSVYSVCEPVECAQWHSAIH